MQDNELYEGILGLEPPWRVVNVILDTSGREIRVEIENEQKRLPCPICDVECMRHDSRRRRWRHLDTCQFQTIMEAEVPRTKCLQRRVKQVLVPWADRGSRFTAMREMLASRRRAFRRCRALRPELERDRRHHEAVAEPSTSISVV